MIHIYREMLTTVRLVDTSITTDSYLFVCVCGTQEHELHHIQHIFNLETKGPATYSRVDQWLTAGCLRVGEVVPNQLGKAALIWLRGILAEMGKP